jgi:hypothetical protein
VGMGQNIPIEHLILPESDSGLTPAPRVRSGEKSGGPYAKHAIRLIFGRGMFDLFVIKLIAGVAVLSLAIRVVMVEAENIASVYKRLRAVVKGRRTSN